MSASRNLKMCPFQFFSQYYFCYSYADWELGPPEWFTSIWLNAMTTWFVANVIPFHRSTSANCFRYAALLRGFKFPNTPKKACLMDESSVLWNRTYGFMVFFILIFRISTRSSRNPSWSTHYIVFLNLFGHRRSLRFITAFKVETSRTFIFSLSFPGTIASTGSVYGLVYISVERIRYWEWLQYFVLSANFSIEK